MTLYLKYRPRKISELDLVEVRDHLSAILGSGKSLPHAWLFAGPRGTGKTSAARILAKKINGNNKDLNLEIETGTATDVVEIDAASNRGIDEIRDLREKISLAPMRAKYKVYIIDEAHMLTTEAANALLKTLEEPPEHAVFVLCTTDAQKLPETVISRCTQIQFKRPSIEEIVDKLKIVVSGEKLKMDNGQLAMIAQAAGGSFRDAIKILEQVITSGQDVEKIVGMSQTADPSKFIKLLRDEDTKGALEFVTRVVNEGISPRSFIERCVMELRDMLVESLDKSLLPLIAGLEDAYEKIRTTSVPQLPLEIFVIENSKIKSQNSNQIQSSNLPKQESKLEPKPESKPEPRTQNLTPDRSKGKFKLEDVVAKWPEILRAVKPMNHSVEALLRSTRPSDFDGQTLGLEVFYKFHKDKLETDRCRKIVEETVGNVFGLSGVKLSFSLGEKKPVVARVEDDIIKAAEDIFKVVAV